MNETAPVPDGLPTSTAAGFPSVVVDGIARAVQHALEAQHRDIAAALKAWGDLLDLPGRVARIEVRDAHGPYFGAALADRTIVLADTGHYGTAPPGPVNVDRHERTFAGRTYNVALLHRDEAAKLPAADGEAPS